MESPFAHLLNTNHVPDNQECKAINAFLSDPLIELSRLDDEIVKYKKLLAKREELNQMIDSHRALLSPARRLPPELVKQIFLLCLPENRKAAMSSLEAPVLLGRICSAWRHISLTTPQLWSSIHIVVPDNTEQVRRRAKGVKTWLAQAGVLPLSISIIDSNNPEGPDRDPITLVACLIPYSRQWNHINLRMPYPAFKVIATLLPEDVPLLESVIIQNPLLRVDRANATWKKMLILRGPRLRSLSVHLFKTDPRALAVQWDQLTELHLEGGDAWSSSFRISTRAALDIVSLCPKLVSCTLLVCWPDDFIPPGVQIVLPSLQTIRIIATYEVHLDEFFDYIVAPNLCDITISGTKNPSRRQNHVPFLSLILSHPHNFHTLRLETGSISPEALVECLRLTSSLSHLTINDRPYNVDWTLRGNRPVLDDGLLNRLTPTHDNQLDYLCPKLQHLEMTNGHISDKALLTLIEERAKFEDKGTARLRRVEATTSRVLEIDVLAQLRPLRDAGLAISLRYRSTVPRKAFNSPWHGLEVGESSTEALEAESS